jgi:MFS family permease
VKILVLSVLYLAQGLPYGFQTFALPVMLRRQGTSLTAIGFVGALALPWMLKPLWAPLVDRYGRTRRAWIVPLMLALAATLVAAGFAGLATLLALIFVMNLLAATQDIAVDGLAVDLLGVSELGAGNAAQVAGYKVGMLLGGSLFVWASVWVAPRLLFFGLAAIALAAAATAAATHEAPRSHQDHASASLRDIVAALVAALRSPGNRALLLFIGTYKVGEGMAEAMWKPFLIDRGFDDAFIGGVFGTAGMAASIVGSLAGGFLATRVPFERAVWLPAAARIVPLAGQAIIAATTATRAGVIALASAEHLAGGALTTVVFALMMSRVDRRIGATHYTVLAAVEVLGKFPGAWVSGPIAERFGYPALFGLAAALTGLLLATIIPLGRGDERSRPAPAPAPGR